MKIGTTAVIALVFLITSTHHQTTTEQTSEAESVAIAVQDLELEFAQTHLALAEHDANRARRLNELFPEMFPSYELDLLDRHVLLDRERVRQAQAGIELSQKEFCLLMAKNSATIAKLEVERLEQLQQRQPTPTVNDRLERAKLVSRLTDLNVKRTQTLDAEVSTLIYLQWQLEELQHQVHTLKLLY